MLGATQQMLGRVRGGLAVGITLMGVVLAAATGIIGASVVLLGLISVPVLLGQGYRRPLALGTVAAAGCLGILIPPSIMPVVMGDQLGLPVGDLFMAAVLPGLLLAGLYLLYLLGYGLVRPQHVPLAPDTRGLGWRTLGATVGALLPPALLVLAVLGSIFAGIATVTEASGIGALGASLLAWAQRRLGPAVLKDMVLATFRTCG
jgi:TRAP-type mannitol/chloroaromatic compound transport system permease large subunit